MYIAVGKHNNIKYWCGNGFTKKSCKRNALVNISLCTDSFIHLTFEKSDRIILLVLVW